MTDHEGIIVFSNLVLVGPTCRRHAAAALLASLVELVY